MDYLLIMRAGLFLILHSITSVSAAVPPPETRPGCQSQCGNVNIPFPFGIGPRCHLDGFNISCHDNKPFLAESNIEVLEILFGEGLLRVNQLLSKDCYSPDGSIRNNTNTYINLADLPYQFSDNRNKFVAIGCDTFAIITDKERTFTLGCTSVCGSIDYVKNGTCSGIGCCEIRIPKGIHGFEVNFGSYYNHTYCADYNPCSYAFLAEQSSFNFSTSYLKDLQDVTVMPVTLDWSIGGNSKSNCSSIAANSVCVANNSYCIDTIGVEGYRCNCSEGYTGNPYLPGGCGDVNECDNKSSPCIWKENCENSIGNYTCTCPDNMDGDGRINGTGCLCKPGTQPSKLGCKKISKFPVQAVIIGLASAIIFLTANVLWSYWALRKKKLIKLKEKFFQQNGGFLLEKQMSQTDGATGAMKIFSAQELEEATDNFSEYRVLGKGGFGTVYKGILSDGRIVAVKKSKISNEEQNEQFINEVVVLSNINHRNVVKLLGLCLETQVPLLIYEFILNGTLSEQIHDDSHKGSLSLENRLRIAVEIAEALAYLHSSASIPILHRDIKSSNILLDDNYVAKVSDFGMSRLVAFDQNCLNSLVRGTIGYLDPEYFQSGVFTEKSDVYSFGVLLIELLTGQKAVLLNRIPGNGNLAGYFISYFNENRLEEIVEDRIRDEGQKDRLFAVAEVAIRCLSMKRNERPTMKEVSKDLEELMFFKHPWTKKSENEIEPLLMKPLLYDPELFGVSTTFTEGESSTNSLLPLNIMR